MHISAGVTSVIGFLGIVLMASCSSLDEPRSAQEVRGDHEFSCRLYNLKGNEFQDFTLPPTLTFVQHGYLSVLCSALSVRITSYRKEDSDLQLATIDLDFTEEELQVERAIHALQRTHLERDIALFENAMRTAPFHEVAFWEAWQHERERYNKVGLPLVRQKIRLMLERIAREGGDPEVSRQLEELREMLGDQDDG